MSADVRVMAKNVEIKAPIRPGYEKIMSAEAVAFLAGLERKFGPERKRLLRLRAETQARLDAGWRPDFPAETKSHPRRRIGPSRRCPRICSTAASKSPVRSTARW